MFETIRSAWKIKDLRTKILWTLLLIVIYRLGCFIPVPGVNSQYIAEMVGKYDMLGFLDVITGGSFANFTIFAMGITPYINASIIMNLLTIAIPSLERMAKEGDQGRKKIEKITRILGVCFAFIMSMGISMGLGPNAVLPVSDFPLWMSYATIALVLTAGTAFLMWLGEKITNVGIGNGISFIIFASIVSRVPTFTYGLFERTFKGEMNFWLLPVLLVLVVAIIAGVTFVDMGVRKIPVQYAKRVVGRKVYGGQSTHIPIKVNSNGVLPLIFAMTLMQLPGLVAQFWPESGFYAAYIKYFGTGTVTYFFLYTALIVFFSYFYTMITFNPIEMSKNIQANGGFVPGIRPGRPTSDYLGKISNRLTLFSAIFLALIAAIPTLFTNILGSSSAFGATSILIMVSVALETSKTLEAQMTMRHYKGFLK